MTSAVNDDEGPADPGADRSGGGSSTSTSTMLDVARRAGVSVSTVSRALRGAENVRPDTTARVRAAAAALGFSASPSAAGLATGKVKRIALLIGSPLTDWFSGSIIDGVHRVVRAAGFDLLLYHVHDPDERAAFFATLPARRNADALIVASFALSAEELATLDRMGTPLVSVNQHVAGSRSVGIDDAGAGALATRYLVGLGHRRLRYVRAEARPGFAWSARDRLTGFAEVCEGAGIADADVLEAPQDIDFGPAIASALLSGPLPVAVVAEYDELALRLLLALRQQGVRVPEDVSIIGFDGQESATLVGLTTVEQPVADLAALAGHVAVDLALGRSPADAPRRIELPTRLRVARTTAAPRP